MVSAKAMSARICEGCEGFCEGRPSPINRMHNQGLSSIVKGVKGFLPPYMRARAHARAYAHIYGKNAIQQPKNTLHNLHNIHNCKENRELFGEGLKFAPFTTFTNLVDGVITAIHGLSDVLEAI